MKTILAALVLVLLCLCSPANAGVVFDYRIELGFSDGPLFQAARQRKAQAHERQMMQMQMQQQQRMAAPRTYYVPAPRARTVAPRSYAAPPPHAQYYRR